MRGCEAAEGHRPRYARRDRDSRQRVLTCVKERRERHAAVRRGGDHVGHEVRVRERVGEREWRGLGRGRDRRVG